MTGVAHLGPLTVVVPLVAAALIAALGFLPRRVHETIAIATAVATAVMCAVLLAHTQHGPIVYWLGGWRPHHGVALGISLTVDQLGAGMALLCGTLVTAALVYSTRYFDELDHLFPALMLVFMAGMIGFCLTGDLFNMFVFFELMGVAAFALTAMQVEERAPVTGAINFAVTNSVAAFGALIGIGLLYGRTGALNLAQVGASLDHRPPDSLVALALILIALAFLTKAAAVPFHFWLADAHAVAPAPVCVLFSGVMVEIGLFGAARVLATAFAPSLELTLHDTRAVLVGVGAVTAAVAALNCFQQRHLKRLLAFSTISHMGIVICGLALATGRGLAGAASYALGHGLAKGALFMAAGVLLYRHATIDEYELRGRGRGMPGTAAVFLVGGLLLASAPLGTTFFGKSLIEDAATTAGYDWLPPLLALCSAVTAGAVLRAGARIFLGWGLAEHETSGDEAEDLSQEEAAHEEGADLQPHEHVPARLVVLPLVLMAAAIVAGLIPGLVPSIERAAAHFQDHAVNAARVLAGQAPAYPPVAESHVKATAVIYGIASTLGALLFAWLGLFGRRIAPARVIDVLRAAHSGHIGDYIAWWTFGMAAIGGLLLWAVTG